MYCPKCGNPEQVAGTYCRQCGVFLFDASDPSGTSRSAEGNLKVPTFNSAFRVAVCFTFAILLFAVLGSQPGSNPLINITAVILFAMGLVQFNDLRSTISQRKRLEKQELAAKNNDEPDKLLEPANFADLVPDSVTSHTTRQLVQNRKRDID